MRILLTLTTLTCGLALAADGPQTVTYIGGNLTGLTANTGATLDVTTAKSMALRTGQTTVEIPYDAISKAEIGSSTSFSEKQPLYKVWALPKRFMGKSEIDQVVVNFKNQSGEAQTMTLEMEKPMADKLLAAIDAKSNRKAGASSDWWGDSLWKTTRNNDQWSGAGTLATRE